MKKITYLLLALTLLPVLAKAESGFRFYASSTVIVGTLSGDGSGLSGVITSETDPVYAAAASGLAKLASTQTLTGVNTFSNALRMANLSDGQMPSPIGADGNIFYNTTHSAVYYSNGIANKALLDTETDPVYAAAASGLAKLASTQTLTGINTFSNTGNVYYGDGSNLSGITSGVATTSSPTWTGQHTFTQAPTAPAYNIGGVSVITIDSLSQGNLGVGKGVSAGTGDFNTFVGENSGSSTVGSSNIHLGYNAGSGQTAGSLDTIIGYNSGVSVTGSNNTFVGATSGNANTAGAYNSFFGLEAGKLVTSGNDNTFLGARSGGTTTTGTGNIAIGKSAYLTSAASSNQLNIGNSIYGDLSTDKIGIGVVSPTVALDVAGEGQFTSSVTALGTITASSFVAGYTRPTNVCGSATTCVATCATGKVLGGGCSASPMVSPLQGYPSADTTYTCDSGVTGNLTAYAVCAKLE